MLRPPSLLPALVLGVATMLGATGTAHAAPSPAVAASVAPGAKTAAAAPAASPDEDAEPGDALELRLDGVTPAIIPRRGPLVLRGRVTNTTAETWTDINLHPVVSASPMTTGAELDVAAASPDDTVIGDRIQGSFGTVEELAAGSTRSFEIRLPQSELAAEITGAPGVYWLGVHALGQSPAGRSTSAVGRVRTFIPLVGRTRRSVETALVLPVRRGVAHTGDGKVDGVDRWSRDLRSGGRLDNILSFGEAAEDRPLTWLLDPAVPDTVSSLADGNPARFIGPTIDPERPEDEPEDGASPSAPEITAEPVEDAPDDEREPLTAAEETAMELSGPWLDRLSEVLGAGQVLALPYGDLDVAAAGEHKPPLYALARQRSDVALEQLGVKASPAIAPPHGYLDEAGLAVAREDDTVLLTDATVTGAPDPDSTDPDAADPDAGEPDSGDPDSTDEGVTEEEADEIDLATEDAPAVVRLDGQRVLLSDEGASAGGPGPSDALAPLALRQRILGEAALRILTEDETPLVISLPVGWSPTSTRDFFEGLDEAGWLELTTLEEATESLNAQSVDPGTLAYPALQAELELPSINLTATEGLVAIGETLQNVLARNDAVAAQVTDDALPGASYFARTRPAVALARTEASRAWIQDLVASVRIEAPTSVTLSSESGRFSVTLLNDLDQPVVVRIEAVTASPLSIRAPSEIRLEPDSSRTVLLQANSEQIGVHSVTLEVTDLSGQRLGSSDTLPLRTAQVSEIIWVIMGIGAGLLFGAIALRLVRRLRRSRADDTTTPDE
ncbi:DUF6049 family protein [Nocardioides pacificus]